MNDKIEVTAGFLPGNGNPGCIQDLKLNASSGYTILQVLKMAAEFAGKSNEGGGSHRFKVDVGDEDNGSPHDVQLNGASMGISHDNNGTTMWKGIPWNQVVTDGSSITIAPLVEGA